MAIAQNDVTGDELKSKVPSEAYLNNYDLIFGKKEKKSNDSTDGTTTEQAVNDNGG